MKKLFSVLLVMAMLACMLPVFAVSAATNYDVPCATIDGEAATGYSACANKPWESTADGLKNGGEGGGIFLFDQKAKAGTIEVNIDKTNGGDAGVVFGLQGDSNDFWENHNQYYLVFVTDNKEVLLSKCGEGLIWCWTKAIPVPNFDKANTDLKVEWNGTGRIQITVNGQKLYDFCDTKPLTGDRFGFRAGNPGAIFKDIKVTTAEVTNEGAEGGIALPFATSNGNPVTGYIAAGPWVGDQPDCTITDTGLKTNRWTNILMVEDQMPMESGSSLTAVVGTPAGRAPNVTGIFFGREGTKNSGAWADVRTSGYFYTLTINGAGQLVLSKNSLHPDYDPSVPKAAWDENIDVFTTLAGGTDATKIEGFAHGGTATLKVEFVNNDDGSLTILGYANDVKLIEYTDATPCTGARYGFMAREAGSTLGAMTAVYEVEEPAPDTTDEPVSTPATGDMISMAVAISTLALIGTAVIVSKKRHYN